MNYRMLLILAVLLALPFSLKAGSVYDLDASDSIHVNVGYLTADDIDDMITLTTGALCWDIDTMRVWQPSKKPPHDTTTHYVVRVDSAWIVGKIECDTVPVNFKTVNDTVWAERLDIKCDTTYRQRLTFVWAPLVTVKLHPDQIEKLMELLAK